MWKSSICFCIHEECRLCFLTYAEGCRESSEHGPAPHSRGARYGCGEHRFKNLTDGIGCQRVKESIDLLYIHEGMQRVIESIDLLLIRTGMQRAFIKVK